MKRVRSALKNYIVDAVLLIVVGLILVIWPEYSLKIIFTWIGIGLIVVGVFKGIMYFTKKDKKEKQVTTLLVGLLQIVLGIFGVVQSEFLAENFPVAAAILLLLGAIVMLFAAFRLRKGGSNVFTLCLILGLITLLLAVIIFIDPAFIANIIIQFTGISLIAEGISLLIVLSR